MNRIPFQARLAACAALAAFALPASAGARFVPWVDRPAAEAPAAPTPPAATRACAASDFRATAGAAGAWHGFATQELLLARTGADRCRLDAVPAIELVSAQGLRQSIDTANADDSAVRTGLDLGPRDSVSALVGTPGACEATTGPERRVNTRLRLAPTGGGELLLDGVHVDTICGAARLLALQPRDLERTATPLGALQASLDEIGPARAGAPLRYVVTLRNAGAQAVDLSRCPAFTQTVSVEDRSSAVRGQLACAEAGGRIEAGASVAFEMRVPVPAGLQGAGLKLGWSLQDGPAAGAIVQLQ